MAASDNKVVHDDETTSPASNLSEIEDPFRTIAEVIPGLLWICSPEGVCNYASRRCREYTGADFGQSPANGGFNFAHPDDRNRVMQAWTESVRSGHSHETEVRLRRHDGEYRWHRACGIPERDKNDAVKRWVVVCIDIDEAKKFQQESAEMRATLTRAKGELEHAVAERTHQLQEVVDQLEAFAYTIAHDMRAPLRSMHQYAEVVARDFAPQIPPEAHPYLRKIMGAAEKLDSLIRKVLVYTRVSQGSLNLRVVKLDDVLAEVLIMYPQLNPPHMEVNIRKPMHCVIGDETALIHVFSNLLSNAGKFVPADRKPKIEIWSEATGQNTRIFIKDNGIGIPSQGRDRIFQMFERLQPESKYEGSGIGLTIVRRAVERMGGTIGVESAEGQGSTFWIELKKGEPC